MEIWSLTAAINVKQALPLIETQVETINVKAMAKRIHRKYRTPAHWNCIVSERCEPEIKALLILPQRGI